MDTAQRKRLVKEARAVRQRLRTSDAFGYDLNGACAIASLLLFRRLRSLGIAAKICLNKSEDHCYVMVGDVLVDVTASQFGPMYAGVVVSTLKELRAYYTDTSWWTLKHAYVREGWFHRAISDWPEEQQPSTLLEQGLV